MILFFCYIVIANTIFFVIKNKKHIFALVLTSLLTAITVVLGRFLSVNVWNMSIGFSFVSVMLCGMLLGSFWGGVCGGLADLIGALLFPFGPYFPGFTVTAFLKGTVYGIVGRIQAKGHKRWVFYLITVALLTFSEGVFSLLLNSLWISLLYGSPFTAVMVSRIPLCAVTLLLQVIFAVLLSETALPKIRKEI